MHCSSEIATEYPILRQEISDVPEPLIFSHLSLIHTFIIIGVFTACKKNDNSPDSGTQTDNTPTGSATEETKEPEDKNIYIVKDGKPV